MAEQVENYCQDWHPDGGGPRTVITVRNGVKSVTTLPPGNRRATMRKYTVDEIQTMREAVTALGGSGGAEDRLRTYMQNGTEPPELVEAARQEIDPIMKNQRRLQKLAGGASAYQLASQYRSPLLG